MSRLPVIAVSVLPIMKTAGTAVGHVVRIAQEREATAVVGAVGLLQDQMGVRIASRASVRHMVDVDARGFPVEPDSCCMLSR